MRLILNGANPDLRPQLSIAEKGNRMLDGE